MEYALFIYNFLLCVFLTVNATVFFFLYKKTNKSIYLWIFLMFAVFLCFEFLYYMADYMDHFRQYYTWSLVNHPIIVTALYFLLHIAFANITVRYFDSAFKTADRVFFILFSLAILVLPMLPASDNNLFFYFLVIQLMRYYWLARGFAMLKKAELGPKKTRQTKLFIYAAFAINTLALLENCVIIYLYDSIRYILPTASHRNISADILTVYMAVVAFTAALRLLSGRYYIHGGTEDYLLKLDGFSKQYGFTQREKEILSYIVQDRSNQEIADLLYISTGTAKNHIHKIYQKTGTSGRSQLMLMALTGK